MTRSRLALPLLIAATVLASTAHAVVITTNVGNGADAEVRESNPLQNRGSSTEIATRVIDHHPAGSANDNVDRNSVFYLQFDLAGLVVDDAASATLRLTYRNNNLTETRVTDTDGSAPDYGQNGLMVYGVTGVAFDENTITYANAPGLTPDGDVGTMDFNGAATLLGDVDFPELVGVSNLPVGGALDFSSGALANFIQQQIMSNPNGVAVLAVSHRNLGLPIGGGKGGDEPVAWSNFNYLFNPKEQTTLNSDLNSPWSQADNSTGMFSPRLILEQKRGAAVVLPAPIALLAAGLLSALVSRRRA